MVTIKDIAKIAGVSKATVSKALNNKSDISKKTKKKIKKIAEEMGYIPNSIAKCLVEKKTYTIGLVLPYLGNPTTIERIKGINDSLFNYGFALIICFSEKQNQQNYIKEMI
ncbi:MAG: LacI family transcriptional regulator, partial [bacterium]|nr:LacI family transcriptional regulator [bacterium]MDW8164758.1 LacI family DNA-binding transcriptional regulator [Candidatus Omnitrophota bacterium]